MKRFFNLTARKIVESSLIAICLVMQLIIMLSKVDGLNVFQRGFTKTLTFNGETVLNILFILNVIVCLFTISFTIVKKSSPYLFGIIWNFITAIALFVVNNILHCFVGRTIGSLIIYFVLIALAFGYHIACVFINPDSFEKDENVEDSSERLSNVSKVFILICTILALGSTITSLFIPLFRITVNDTETLNIPINALLFPTASNLSIYISFIVLFVINLLNFGLFLKAISYFKQDDGIYLKKSKDIINLDFVVSILYFIIGVSIAFFINKNDGKVVTTFAYVPFIIMSIIMVIFAVASINLPITKKENKEKKFPRLEMLIYVIIFTLLPVLTIFLKLIVVEANGVEQISIKAYDIIKDYHILSGSYQLTAFFIVILSILVISLFVLTLTTFFKNKSLFYKFAMSSIFVDALFIFAIGTFGFYYKIVQTMNEEKLTELFAHYGFNYSSPDYAIKSQTMYVFFVSLILLVAITIRNPLRDLPAGELTINAINQGPIVDKPINNEKKEEKESKTDEPIKVELIEEPKKEEEVVPVEEAPTEVAETLQDFDACPAFSELDSKIDEYKKQLRNRKSKQFENPTLPSVAKFVVDYARESRLHLSYSVEDVATFIAGLGACRLSILQGMSGTGKTSLPKIFLEAIMGNCEIIEVESSWRDKNELLGYYNEFSKTFTPKKFTQALYKAKLNETVPTFIVLDEMNLSRIEYYFSDFLSLMENEEGKREIKLLNVKLYNTYENEKHEYKALSEDHTIKIPSNIWFIGTANRDESTFEISDKVYDRAHTMNFNKRAPKAIYSGEVLDQRFLPYDAFSTLLNNAKSSYEFDIDKNQTIKEVERILAPYNISFGNRISLQIETFVKVYCSCFDNPKEKEDEAVETILLSKVVAKLESKSVENKEVLISEFNKLKLKRCSDFISKLNED